MENRLGTLEVLFTSNIESLHRYGNSLYRLWSVWDDFLYYLKLEVPRCMAFFSSVWVPVAYFILCLDLKGLFNTTGDNLAGGVFINVIEIIHDGWISRMRLGVKELLTYFADQEPVATGQAKSSVSCFKDLVIQLTDASGSILS